ncbi:NAD-P-binding protein [Crepidotus variabilis]|uniref:NAD-P-binding protein n=1 Tax=Crepidotus variabilis TaxID=179855 RepID=A0A9P6EDB1_9AGAR|nr:NAD-P-binding protein [Crepidotus variabilis]
MAITQTEKTFLSSPHFAVVGASKDQSKIGTKVLQWYQHRKLDVTPVHPKEKELESLQTVTSVAELSSPTKTSISVITPPKVTLSVLKAAKELSVPAIWIQPGAEDDAVVEYIKDNGLSDSVIYGGSCILVQGDKIRSSL